MTISRLSRPRARRHAVAALIVALFAVAGAVGGRLAAAPAQGPAADPNVIVNPVMYQGLRYRSVGPHRGGRVTAIAGVRSQPARLLPGRDRRRRLEDDRLRLTWTPIGDGQIETGSIGSIDVSESNPDIVWVGTGSAAIRSNVIIGRGIYKSVDAGRTWQFMGLREAGRSGPWPCTRPTPTWCGWPPWDRPSARRRARRVQDHRRRPDVEEARSSSIGRPARAWSR